MPALVSGGALPSVCGESQSAQAVAGDEQQRADALAYDGTLLGTRNIASLCARRKRTDIHAPSPAWPARARAASAASAGDPDPAGRRGDPVGSANPKGDSSADS